MSAPCVHLFLTITATVAFSKYDVVDLWISVPETCSNMQKSCLQLRYVYSVIYMMVAEKEAAHLST